MSDDERCVDTHVLDRVLVQQMEVRVDAQRRVYRLRPEPLREIDDWRTPSRAAGATGSTPSNVTSTRCPTRRTPWTTAISVHSARETTGGNSCSPAGSRYPPEKVWHAVRSPSISPCGSRTRSWGSSAAGVPLKFVMAGGHGFDGEMLEFDPPSVMELLWGTDRIRIEVRPDGSGSMLTLTDSFAELGKAARDAAGWHECLDRLGCDLAGTEPPAWVDRGAPFTRLLYVERLGPEAAAIGPPEGIWAAATALEFARPNGERMRMRPWAWQPTEE